MTCAHDAPGPRAKAAGDLDLALVDQREGGEQRPQHERRVDRHFGEDDAPGRIEKIDRRRLQAERACISAPFSMPAEP